MRKGIIRITFGAILIAAQILSYVGNLASEGIYFFSTFSLIYFLSYNLAGIIGATLLYFGIRAFSSREKASFIIHPKRLPVLKYIFIALLSLLAIDRFLSMNKLNIESCCIIISSVLLIMYFVFFYGKKPSLLFPAAIIFAGIGYLVHSLRMVYFYTIYADAALFGTTLQTFAEIAIGILYVIYGILIYKEKHSAILTAVCGWSSLACAILFVIASVAQPFFVLNLLFIFPITIFVYTVVVPICNNRQNHEIKSKDLNK